MDSSKEAGLRFFRMEILVGAVLESAALQHLITIGKYAR
jgi:hypothetical protein